MAGRPSDSGQTYCQECTHWPRVEVRPIRGRRFLLAKGTAQKIVAVHGCVKYDLDGAPWPIHPPCVGKSRSIANGHVPSRQRLSWLRANWCGPDACDGALYWVLEFTTSPGNGAALAPNCSHEILGLASNRPGAIFVARAVCCLTFGRSYRVAWTRIRSTLPGDRTQLASSTYE